MKGFITMATQEKIRLSHIVIVKAPGLLHMQYTPEELAKDLSITVQMVMSFIGFGAPYSRDDDENIWINGKQFGHWVEVERLKNKPSRQLVEGDAFCQHCKRVVTLVNVTSRHVEGKLIIKKGRCPICQCTIVRGGRDE
jgi:hypothetical protein